MLKGAMLRTAGLGALLGAVVGLLVMFISIVNNLTGPRAAFRDGMDARASLSLSASATDDTAFRAADSEYNLRRIAAVQARTGDVDGALATVNAAKNPASKDGMRNEVIADFLYHKVGTRDKPDEDVYKKARKVADSIESPLIKADALRRIAAAQEPHYPDNAKKTIQEAAQMTLGAPWTTADGAGSVFNMWMLLWPVGLAFFGFLFTLAGQPLCATCCKPASEGV